MHIHTALLKQTIRALPVWSLGVITSLALTGCSVAPVMGGPVDPSALHDGVYQGCYKHGPNKAVVEVAVRDQKIAEVRIIQHSAWKGRSADPIIPHYIVQDQSTAVDVVSGATNSSRVIMNAAHKAIEESYKARPPRRESP